MGSVDLRKQFDHFGLELPDDAARWAAKLIDLQQNRPEPPPRNQTAELIVESADEAVIAAAVAAYVGNRHHWQQHAEAEAIAGRRVLAAVVADRDRIHAELRTNADQIIERLHAAALIEEDIRQLTRERRTDEAHLLATADSDAAELRDAYQLRDYYLTRRTDQWSTGWWSCQHWSNPWDISGRHADHDGTHWGGWRASIRAGGRLWFASHEEAVAASSAHEPAGELIAPYKAFA